MKVLRGSEKVAPKPYMLKTAARDDRSRTSAARNGGKRLPAARNGRKVMTAMNGTEEVQES